MKRLEIHISYNCFNHCIFCSEANRLKRFKDFQINLTQLQQLLIEKQIQGFNHVTFTGGEPSLYFDFYKLLEIAKALKYKIYIGSNGIFWSDYNNCQKFLPLIDEISLSLHGPNENIHNMHTKNNQSFKLIIKAFENINNYINNNKSQHYFFANIVVTKYNLNYIQDILSLIAKFNNLRQILVSYVAPEGQACKNYADLVVAFSKLKQYLSNWITIAKQNEIIIRFFGLPLCILSPQYIYSNDLNYDQRMTYELGKLGNEIFLKPKKNDISRRRQKIKQCNQCNYNNVCGGIFTEYLQLFGDQEIKPF